MKPTELARCKLAMWLDRWKDRIAAIAARVSPPSEVWERYDAWAKAHGHHDWINSN